MQAVIDEFRANNGRVGGWFAGARLLLLTTTGARSGRRHTVVLGYLPDGGERVLVIGSAGGSPKAPAWFHNLRAHPVVTVEDGTFTYEATAVELTGAQRDEAFRRAAEANPGWSAYEADSGRTLPVVALVPIPGPPRTRADGPGEMLKLVHDAFRRELEIIRAEVDQQGAGLGAQLRVNCLSLCAGLRGHHVREDEGLFPWVASQHPDLADAMALLRDQHERMAALIEELAVVLADPGLDAATLRAEVDRLTTQVLDHLDYEERVLIPRL
ncbi:MULTISPECIES: nitroreductase/quinone reductase family protein [Actinoplanes]|uniref:nitroreductase/quinone reductase family protein n=1 Tax=Actinoplanes TaxID=1865 RepID=UPI000AF07B63|nr:MULTISPECIES: nitroreductase/quinone reductase family protein [Actinoplanes]GLY02939.1 cation-binding protein [Actinoplanes sp. NBRC 101535]